MIELNLFQIILIISLPVVFIGGLWNQKRMIRKKQELEGLPLEEDSENNVQELSQEEKQTKDYIEGYKNQYSKDAIKEALKTTIPDETKLDEYLTKYY